MTMDQLTGLSDFDQRSNHFLHALAQHEPTGCPDRTAWVKQAVYYAMAKLACDTDEAKAVEMIADCLREPAGGAMFLRHALMDVWLRFGSRLPPELRDGIKAYMLRFDYAAMIATGTENHKLMEAAAGCLAAQTWPEELAGAERQRQACEAYLLETCRRYVSWGLIEFDSPTYNVIYVTTLLTVRDFTAHNQLRTQAEMTIEWMLANIAGEWVDGYYTASSLRMTSPMLDPFTGSGTTVMAWLYFGGRAPILPGEWRAESTYAVINALSSFRCPAILSRIAADRQAPLLTREGHDLNGAFNPPGGYCKTTFTTSSFGLSSHYDGNGQLGWSGQMTKWILRWVSDQPGSSFFMKHPLQSRDYMGATAYEQVLQCGGTLAAVYRIPGDDPCPYVEGPLPLAAVSALLERNNRLHVHGGAVLFAVASSAPLSLPKRQEQEPVPHLRLRLQGTHLGLVVEVAEAANYQLGGEEALSAEERAAKELARFAEDLAARSAVDWDGLCGGSPALIYTNLEGRRLLLEYGGRRSIDGREQSTSQWPLIENRFMEQRGGGYPLVLRHGGEVRTYDFDSWTCTTRQE